MPHAAPYPPAAPRRAHGPGALTLAACLLLTLAACRRDPQPSAAAWWAAVQAGTADTALAQARLLAPPHSRPTAPDVYRDFFENGRLDPAFLDADFHPSDMTYWHDLAGYQRLNAMIPPPAGAAPSFPDQCHAVMTLVRDHVTGEEPVISNAYPMDIWERGYGVCDRLCWLAAALLYQRGYDVAIVYLYAQPSDRESNHTILEVRHDTAVCLVDPLTGWTLPHYAVEDLAADPDRAAALWPERPQWPASLANARLFIPSRAQDYCPRIQALARRVAADSLPGAPRFGEDPLTRSQRYNRLRSAQLASPPAANLEPWNHPLRLLRKELRRSSPATTDTHEPDRDTD